MKVAFGYKYEGQVLNIKQSQLLLHISSAVNVECVRYNIRINVSLILVSRCSRCVRKSGNIDFTSEHKS